MSGELYDLALTVPWCMVPDALEAMLSIAARDPLPADEIARRMHGSEALAQRRGEQRSDSRRMTMHGSVAVLPIDGPIYRYADMFTAVSGGVTTEALSRDLALARDDPAVSAVLIPIDSPGGEVIGTNEFAEAIYAMRGIKPIIAYIEGYGASAAYWFASAADYVIVDATAKLGSIGVVMGVSDPTKRVSRSIDFVSSQSPKKRADPTTADGRAYYQELTDSTAEVFVSAVMRNRGLTREQVLAIGGGMLIGQAAIEAGLADALGSEESILRALARGEFAAFLPSARQSTLPLVGGQRAAKEHTPMAKGFWAWMGGTDEAPATPPPALVSEQLARIESSAATIQPMPSSQADDDRTAKVASENAELRKQLAQARATQIQTEALSFAKEQIGSGHTYPVASAQLIALYALAAEDDAAAPLEGGRSRVSAVRAFVEAQPANRLASNLLDPAFAVGSKVLTNAGGAADTYAEDETNIRAYGEKANGKRA